MKSACVGVLSIIDWKMHGETLKKGFLPVYTAYEDGTDRVFRNVAIYTSAAGESPKRKNTIFSTRRMFEIKNVLDICLLVYCLKVALSELKRSCHWALNNEQLVADGSLLASFIFVIVSIWTLLPCKIHRVSDGELLHFLYYFWGAAVQVLCITVTRICDLHLVFGSGPGWLRLYCSWLSIRRAEAQKKGAKTSPCPLIHPALQATALSIGWSARDRWLTCRRGSLHRSIDSFGGAWLQGYCDALVYGSGTRIPPHSPPSHNWDTIIWWGQHVWSLLISVGGLCYQTPCHSCFRLATLLIFVTPAQDIAPAL